MEISSPDVSVTRSTLLVLIATSVIATGILGAVAVVIASPSTALPVGLSIATGDSMGEHVPQVVLYGPSLDGLEAGQTAVFETSEGWLRHQLIERTADGWITQGSAEPHTDQYSGYPGGGVAPVASSQIAGIVYAAVPITWIGGALLTLLTGLAALALHRTRETWAPPGTRALSAGRGVVNRLSRPQLSGARKCLMASMLVLAAVSGAVTFGPLPGVDKALGDVESVTGGGLAEDFEDANDSTHKYFNVTSNSWEGSQAVRHNASGEGRIKASFGDGQYDSMSYRFYIGENLTGGTSAGGRYFFQIEDSGDPFMFTSLCNTNEFYVGQCDSYATTVSNKTWYIVKYDNINYSQNTAVIKLINDNTGDIVWQGTRTSPWGASSVSTLFLDAQYDQSSGYVTTDFLAADGANPGVEVSGNISGDAGGDIGGATVELRQSGTVVKSTTASSVGGYNLSGVSDGDYSIRASAIGYQNSSKNITVSGSPKAVNLSLTGSTLIQTVNSSGSPISNYSIDIYENGIQVGGSRTNSSGYLRFPLADSTYSVEGSKGGYLALQDSLDVSGTTSATYEVASTDGALGELVYNPNNIITINITRGGNVSSYSRNLTGEDVVLGDVRIEPNDPLQFRAYEYRNGSTFLRSTFVTNGSSGADVYTEDIDYSNRRYIAAYRNGTAEQTFYPVDWLQNGTFNFFTDLSGSDEIAIRGPFIEESGSPTCENVTIYTNDAGQVTGTSNDSTFLECLNSEGIDGGNISVAGANYTTSSDGENTTYALDGGNTTNISSNDVSTRIESDRVAIPRPDEGESVRVSLDGELVVLNNSTASIGGNDVLNWTGGTYNVSNSSNMTTNSTHAVLRGDVVLLPGGTPIEPTGNFTSRPQAYYEDVRMRISGPGIIDLYIDSTDDAEAVSGFSFSTFGGEAEFTIRSLDRSVAGTYGENVLSIDIHSIDGYSSSIRVDDLVSGQSYALYRDGELVKEKTAEGGKVTFDVQSGSYTMITGKSEEEDTAPPGGSSPSSTSPFPVWILAVVSIFGLIGAFVWYRETQGTDKKKQRA